MVTRVFAGGAPGSVTRPDTVAVPSFPGGPAGAFEASGAFGLQAARRSARGISPPRRTQEEAVRSISFGTAGRKSGHLKTFDSISGLRLCQIAAAQEGVRSTFYALLESRV